MRRTFRIRLRLVSVLLALFALLLIIRLYFVQVVHGADYASRAERQYVSASKELFDRGSIFFTRKDGTHISAATLQSGFTIAINPSHLSDPETAFTAIHAVASTSREAFFALLEKKEDPYEVVVRRVGEAEGRLLSEQRIPGVIVERERWRTYPAGETAAQSIGFVAYAGDDALSGRFGLERYYNDVLMRGDSGAFNNFFAELFANLDSVVSSAQEMHRGDVITSIDPVVAEKLAQILKDTGDSYQSIETGGIIMNPKTGEILALHTYPSFDPNDFAHGDSEHFGNPLVEHRYEFGSIVKALTIASGIDSGAIRPDSTYTDTGCTTLNNKKICNYDGKARAEANVQQILSESLNLGAAWVAGKVGHERFRNYLIDLGLGTETGIDLPGEIAGDIKNVTESPRDIEHATASYGQGIAQTPVQMIRALSALANEGNMVTPHVVTEKRLESGITKKLTWGEPRRVYASASTDAVTRLLVRVVDESLGGGAYKIPEMSVAAKTGTAQVAGPGGKYLDNLYFHSFFGYFPAYDPEFIILLYTRHPQGVRYASETLTKPFMDLTRFLINYYAVPPDRL